MDINYYNVYLNESIQPPIPAVNGTTGSDGLIQMVGVNCLCNIGISAFVVIECQAHRLDSQRFV